MIGKIKNLLSKPSVQKWLFYASLIVFATTSLHMFPLTFYIANAPYSDNSYKKIRTTFAIEKTEPFKPPSELPAMIRKMQYEGRK